MAARPAGPTDDAPRARPARWLSALGVAALAGIVVAVEATADDPAAKDPAAGADRHGDAAPSPELLEKRALKARETWWSWKPLEIGRAHV